MTKTVSVGPFLGINNRIPDFALHVDKQGDFLRQADNVDIDNAGRLRRRAGRTLVQASTAPHSYFDFGAGKLMVRSGVLYMVTLSPYAEAFLYTLSSNSTVSYEVWAGDVYLTNGTDRLRVTASGAVFPWAITTPAQPTVTTVAGALPAGWYQVALTYSNSVTGEESGCAGSTNYQLTVSGSMQVTIPGTVDGADRVNVYCSVLNGSVPLLQATVVPGGTYTITTVATTGRDCPTLYQEPLPAGSQVFLDTASGALCTVSGSYVYVGETYRPGYYNPVSGFIPFESTVALCAPNQFGVYVVADKTRWFPGGLRAPEDKIQDVLPYGGVPGTFFRFPHNSKVGWFGAKGFVVADPQGQAEAVMSGNVDLTAPASGAVAVLEDRGYRRVVGCGWCLNLENLAATTYSSYSFTSASHGVGTFSDGLYTLSGNLDNTDYVNATVETGRLNFGTEQLKLVPAAYIGLQSDDVMTLRVTGPDDIDYSYDARANDSDLKVQRVDIGRGLRANWFDFYLSNNLGCDFTIASLSFAPLASQRRI